MHRSYWHPLVFLALSAALWQCGSASSGKVGTGGVSSPGGSTTGGSRGESASSGGAPSGGMTGTGASAGGMNAGGSISSGGASASGSTGAASGGGMGGRGGTAASSGGMSAGGGAGSSISTASGGSGGRSASDGSSGGGETDADSSGSMPGIQADGTFVPTCPNLSPDAGGPPAVTPVPSPEQATYQHTELTAFLHFSLATFDGTEQGNPADKPTVFAPTNLTQDTVNSWVSELKAAGFRQATLVAKHSIGFCLWPSKLTNHCNQYSVAESSWSEGQSGGDLVKMWTDAMQAADMRSGVYLAPWDQHFQSSSGSYQSYFNNQLQELATNYGPMYELWLDGNNAGSFDWTGVVNLAHKLAPHLLVWTGDNIEGADIRWIGSENGQASRTTSSIWTAPDGKNLWYPQESDVSDRLPDGDHWFWHPGENPMALSEMQSVYFSTIGMNSVLIFNVPPSNTGAFDPNDVALLQQFGTWYSSLYANNALKGQPVTADSTWATAGFDGSKAVDEDICTYWAAAAGKTTGRLEVDPTSSITFSVISIREPIELGERSTGYHVEIKQNGTWNTPKDSSGNQLKGTVIGERQLWQLNKTTADAIALVIDSAQGVPAISEFGAYNP